jgi:integrase
LLTKDIIGNYAVWLLNERKVCPVTVIDLLRTIRPLRFHPLFKKKNFYWVAEILAEVPADDPERVKRKKALKFRRLADLMPICDLLVKKANAATDARKKAILLRDALLLKCLLILAWRQRNFRECRLAGSSLGGNLYKEEIPPMSRRGLPKSVRKILRADPHAKFWQFSFTPPQMKSKRSFGAVVPRQLVPLLELYLQYRSALIEPGKADPGTLFLSNHGQPLKSLILWHYVSGITSRYAGRQIHPHLFRDIHAEAWLASGRRLVDLSNNLGHVDPSFTKKVYGKMFDESYSTEGIEDWLDNKKRDSEKDGEDDEE